MDTILQGLRATAEPTRLRILGICAHGELTVSELCQILGQSQPRVSRHLKLLVEAGLLDRFQEGNHAYYRLAENGACAALGRSIIDQIPHDDPNLSLDLDRLERVKAARAQFAAEYFRRNAARWNELRALHVDDRQVDAALRALLLEAPVHDLLDIGTGTGRVLELMGPDVDAAVGIDTSREMLSVARTNLDKAALSHCQVRQADMYQLPFTGERFDAVTLHMVLHYADDPSRVVAEAARVLRPNGRLIVVDFAPHAMNLLRDEHAHRWMGFADDAMASFLGDAGLSGHRKIELPGTPLTVCLWQGQRAPAAIH
ncbi:MAG: ArsR/SmtB family transcription factor [Alphaproteobacteria bacterium]